MRLAELLTIDRVDTDLRAQDKREALVSLSRLLASGLDVEQAETERVDNVHRILEARESLASTGVGEGVAIPHGRVPGLERFVGALAIRRAGVAFDAVDGRPASIFFALIGPDRSAGEHLKCLARISRVLRDESVRARLLQAEDPGRALDIVLEVDG